MGILQISAVLYTCVFLAVVGCLIVAALDGDPNWSVELSTKGDSCKVFIFDDREVEKARYNIACKDSALFRAK